PSLDPSAKRLAAMTEDHPLEYAHFEGTIPEGEYGGGTVMVWDKGVYQIEGDLPAAEQLARGEIEFTLQGQKLRGSFVLVNIDGRRAKPVPKSRWLLIKRTDEHANSSWDINQLRVSKSALSGRTLQQIERGNRPKKQSKAS